MKPHINIAASVRQRLLNYAKNANRPFNEILQYYAMERFLFRLSRSSHADRNAKQIQWAAFYKRLEQGQIPISFADIVSVVQRFLSPLITALVTNSPKPNVWNAHGPWS